MEVDENGKRGNVEIGESRSSVIDRGYAMGVYGKTRCKIGDARTTEMR